MKYKFLRFNWNKPICKMCGREYARNANNQKFCGKVSDKLSCSYKNYRLITDNHQKKGKSNLIPSPKVV